MQSGMAPLAGQNHAVGLAPRCGSAVTTTEALPLRHMLHGLRHRAQVAHAVVNHFCNRLHTWDFTRGCGLKARLWLRAPAAGTRVGCQRGAQGAGKGFEHRLALVVCVLTAQVVDVQRDKGVVDKALEKFKASWVSKLPITALLKAHASPTPAARKNPPLRAQRLVQRHIGVAVALYALLVAHGLGQRLPERDAYVFHGVVAVDMQVALGLHIQIY